MLESLVTVEIFVIFIVLVVITAAVTLWWLRKWQSPPSISTDHPGESQVRSAPSPSGPASTDLRTSTLGPSTTPVIHVAPGVERDFTDQVDRFEGLYESLHSACVEARDADECREVLSEWEVRLTYSGGEALQRTWQDAVHETTGLSMLGNGEAASDEDVISLGTGWLGLLRTWGMERDERMMFVLEEEEKKRYRISGTRQVGEWVEVELPCWTYKGEVIERGIARAIAAPG